MPKQPTGQIPAWAIPTLDMGRCVCGRVVPLGTLCLDCRAYAEAVEGCYLVDRQGKKISEKSS